MKPYLAIQRSLATGKILLLFGFLLGLMGICAEDGHGDQTRRIVLSRDNQYTDKLEHGRFARKGTSGPGTGQFVGEGFEFAKGECKALDQPWLNKKGWKPDVLGCGGMVLSSPWCARYRSDHRVQYTLRFVSWTTGPDGEKQRCRGDCTAEKRTVYERTRLK